MPPDELAELTHPASSGPAQQERELERVAATARFFLSAVREPARWIDRRVERIAVDDDDTARRTITIDLRYPTNASNAALPLALREKGLPNGVRVSGLQGEVATLPARDSALVLYASLMFAARTGEIEPDKEQEALLLSVILDRPRKAAGAVEQLCVSEPGWKEERLRSLLELVTLYRPIFALVDPSLERQELTISYPAQSLTRPDRSFLGRARRLIRGRVSIFTTLTAWPAGATTHLEVETPSLAEISSASISGIAAPRQIGPHGSFVQIELEPPGPRPIGLRFIVSLRPVLSASLLTVSLVLFALLVAAGFNALTGAAFAATTVALLSVPIVFLGRAASASGLRAQGLYASLLRGPTLLIAISVTLGLVAIATGDARAPVVPIAIAVAAALAPVPALLRSLIEDAAALQETSDREAILERSPEPPLVRR